eukprot:3329770-Rhodomonas_salina.1
MLAAIPDCKNFETETNESRLSRSRCCAIDAETICSLDVCGPTCQGLSEHLAIQELRARKG